SVPGRVFFRIEKQRVPPDKHFGRVVLRAALPFFLTGVTRRREAVAVIGGGSGSGANFTLTAFDTA
ncbi:MAG: hypothetical protein QNL80_10550, partial [Akkermansiaceae bacterium]